MCGIIAVLRRQPTRPAPDGASLLAGLADALSALHAGPSGLSVAADHVASVDRALRGAPGVRALLGGPDLGLAGPDLGLAGPDLAGSIESRITELEAVVAAFEASLDAGTGDLGGRSLEHVNAELIRLKDGVWAIGRDRLRTARDVQDLAGPVSLSPAAVDVLLSLNVVLSALDRLEVRGRDSAGVHVLLTGHGIDLTDPQLAARSGDPLFTSGSTRAPGGHLSLVYKAAA